MNLPNGAKPVVDARLKGLKPAELLIVSLVGPVGEQNHTVYANAGTEYDWRWVVGLDLCLYVKNGMKWRETLEAVAKCRPNWLGLYNVDQFKGATASYLPRVEDIEKPRNQWRWVLDFLPWSKWQNEEFAWS